ncbi:MAG: SDR family oxidoreductase [Planctomycetes bacterium]|nr:SDR family oxidoreductase [Planctomycetota bacterium]
MTAIPTAPFSLDGKCAIVTGGGSGIGEAIARLFAARGARVAVLDIRAESASAIAAAIVTNGGAASAHACDVTKKRDVDAVFARVASELGRIDILVNNAGIAHVGSVLSTTEEDFDRIYQVNVKGVYLCSQAGVRAMLQNGGGVILNLASIASLIGLEDRFAYSMSKGAVLTMTRSVAVDYMKKNIRCNCVCPARVHTPFVDGFIKNNYPGREKEMFQKLAEYQPLGRMGTPDEVAALALYLCSDQASFITGQAFPIDGGVLVQ